MVNIIAYILLTIELLILLTMIVMFIMNMLVLRKFKKDNNEQPK